MKLRRLFLVLLMATLCFGAMNVHAASGDIASGKSGDLTWRIDANGKLTITGNGDYDEPDWWRYYNQIITAEVSVTGITDTSYMFQYCYSLKSIRFINSDTSKVKNMRGMFYYCESLNSLDLSSFNTENVTDMSNMFYSCESLTSLNLSGLNTKNVTDMSDMFEFCGSLTSVDLSGINTEKVTDMSEMFSWCCNVTSVNFGSINTENVTDMSGMFENCNKLTSVNLSSINTKNVTDMSNMFDWCENLTSVNLSSFNTEKVTDMSEMFYHCGNLTSVNLSSFNTEKVTDMSNMFWYCNNLTSVNLSSFNTANVTKMNCMFIGCSSLTSLNLSSFNTENVTDMSSMFRGCRNLTSLDLSSFNTANVTDMFSMFDGCEKLISLNVSSFSTDKVSDMRYMFNQCCSLIKLNLDSFTFRNTTFVNKMFYCCSSLTTDITLDYSVTDNYYYSEFLKYAATNGGHIRVYYTGNCTKDLAEKIVNTKAGNSNVHLMNGLKTAIESPVPKTLTLTDSGIKFTWSAVEGVVKYRAYYKVNSGNWQKIVDTSGTDCTLPISKLDYGNIYTFTVKGISSDGTRATTLYNKTGLSYAYMEAGTDTVSARNALGWEEIRLDWTPIGPVTKYNVFYREENELTFTPDSTYEGNYAYVNCDLESGKTFVFRIVPYGYPSTYVGYKDISIKCLTSIDSYDLTLVNGLKGVKITWPKVNGAEGYYIYRKTPEGSYKKISTVKGADNLTYTDGTAQSGSNYYYCVRAYSGSTLSSYEGKSIKFLSPIISSDLTLTNTRNGARIAWNKVTGAEGYYVYRRTPEGSYKKIGTVKGNTSCAYTDRTAANGDTYLYCVRAYSGSTLGNYAGKTTVRLSTTDIASLSLDDDGQITLGWILNNEANGYQVQYSEDASFASGTFTTVKIESAETDSTTITGLTAGKTYYVRMRSYKTVGKANYYAGWSAIVKAE